MEELKGPVEQELTPGAEVEVFDTDGEPLAERKVGDEPVTITLGEGKKAHVHPSSELENWIRETIGEEGLLGALVYQCPWVLCKKSTDSPKKLVDHVKDLHEVDDVKAWMEEKLEDAKKYEKEIPN